MAAGFYAKYSIPSPPHLHETATKQLPSWRRFTANSAILKSSAGIITNN